MLHVASDPGLADDPAAQKAVVTAEFAHSGWRLPELLAALPEAPDFYLGPTRQVHAPRWSSGRTVLLGDAAWAAGTGGNGTRCRDRRRLWGTVRRPGRPPHHLRSIRAASAQLCLAGQKQAAEGIRYLPPTQRAINHRNRFFRVARWLPVGLVIQRLATRAAEAIQLPDYPLAWSALANQRDSQKTRRAPSWINPSRPDDLDADDGGCQRLP